MEKPLYDELFKVEEVHWWFVARRSIVKHLLSKYLSFDLSSRQIKIADLGCGCGANLIEYNKSYSVTGMDPSLDAVKYCQKRGIAIQQGALPHNCTLPVNSFHAVLMLDVLEHIEEDEEALGKTYELLNNDGIIVLTVPAYQWLYTKRDEFHHHKRRYSKKQLDQILRKAGFKRVLLSYYNFWLFPCVALVRMIGKMLGLDRSGCDVKVPNRFINRIVQIIFESERLFLPVPGLPFGVSLVAVYKK